MILVLTVLLLGALSSTCVSAAESFFVRVNCSAFLEISQQFPPHSFSVIEGPAIYGFVVNASFNLTTLSPWALSVEENGIIRPSVISTDVPSGTIIMEENQTPWGLDRINDRLGLDGNYSPRDGGRNVDIYILDSGINSRHREFTGRVAAGRNFNLDDQIGTDTDDCNGHGTHVAGLAAGSTVGVSRASTIIPVRIYGCGSSGALIQALQGCNFVMANAASRQRPFVINMSFGGSKSEALDSAIAALVIEAGGFVVAAAGNEGTDASLSSPSGAQSAIAVGASASDDTFASFSNFGGKVALSAPGVAIPSAWIGGADVYAVESGTSMAAPAVAGAIARALGEGFRARVVLCSVTVGALSSLPTASTPNALLYVPDSGYTSGNGSCVTSKAISSSRDSIGGILCLCLLFFILSLSKY